jgi:hypothetical protein
MVKEFKPVSGQEGTVQSLARKALALLKLVEQKIDMEEPRLNPQVKDAQESVEKLILSLEDTKKLAVKNYQLELARIEEEIKETDFREYRKHRT